ncbi:MAG TPA: DUF1501 domain-containing protein [Chthonomonas sp.]|jgi:hypothetical protein|uniref:DUF1501 domain-containing protein n=1 Tax=Chthonomonas sp. TaxID=2282153 RepID=UPI002B4B5D81|nr:DUF1501 domain-containing protein [Chthonomonas sp.]HLH78797.1 DUF1501 domain-containing protein [Chthonomonas sp.]
MLSIPGNHSQDCDGITRRELLRIGGSSILGLYLPEFLALEAKASSIAKPTDKPGFGKAKSVILIFLQGGPSHIDIWDPKPDAPDNIRGEFKPIRTNVPGIWLTEVMPLLAKQMDKATLIRSVSYTPNGLFNHTAAMYQMLTGEQATDVSPSGQLQPPSPADYPNVGCRVVEFKPPDVPMLPFVMLPRPLQESNVIGKAGNAGFLGRAYDPYTLYPPNADTDPNAMDKIQIADLQLANEVTRTRMAKRVELRKLIDSGMPALEKAVSNYQLDAYYEKALGLILSGRARKAFDLKEEPDKVRDRYGRHVFGQSVLMARRLIEAGTRFVQVNWPSVANGDPRVTAWDTHAANFGPLRNLHCPKLDSALSALLEDMHQRGLLEETMVIAIGEFGRSPRLGVSTSGNSNAPDGRDHWPYCYTALVAGGGIRPGQVYGKSDSTGSSPAENPVHPREILATMYHALGIPPDTVVTNYLGQPRPLVSGKPILGLF